MMGRDYDGCSQVPIIDAVGKIEINVLWVMICRTAGVDYLYSILFWEKRSVPQVFFFTLSTNYRKIYRF